MASRQCCGLGGYQHCAYEPRRSSRRLRKVSGNEIAGIQVRASLHINDLFRIVRSCVCKQERNGTETGNEVEPNDVVITPNRVTAGDPASASAFRFNPHSAAVHFPLTDQLQQRLHYTNSRTLQPPSTFSPSSCNSQELERNTNKLRNFLHTPSRWRVSTPNFYCGTTSAIAASSRFDGWISWYRWLT